MSKQQLGRSGIGFSFLFHVIHASPGTDMATSSGNSRHLPWPQILPCGKGMGNFFLPFLCFSWQLPICPTAPTTRDPDLAVGLFNASVTSLLRKCK